MKVFFDNKIQTNYSNEKYVEFAWHPIHTLLAASSYSQSGGQIVAIYQEEGQCLSDSVQRKTKAVSCMAWHPTKKMLAVGWETGEVSIRNQAEGETHQFPHQSIFSTQHLSNQPSITLIRYSLKGSYLLIADALGDVVVWRVDSRGRLNICASKQCIKHPPTCLTLLPPLPIHPSQDVQHLAKLAVSGDESALDMFGWKRTQTNVCHTDPAESTFFLVGAKDGSVHYMDWQMEVVEVHKEVSGGEVRKLMLNEAGSHLCLLSSSMMLTLFLLNAHQHTLTLLQSVRISGQASTTDLIWAGPSLLATCAAEKYIKMWDVHRDENYLLGLQQDDDDLITCLSYSPQGVLACGSHGGRVLQWVLRQERGKEENEWQLLNTSTVSGNVIDLAFGGRGLLSVNALDNMYILQAQESLCCYCQQVAVVQTSPMQLSVDHYASQSNFLLNTDIRLKAMSCTAQSIVVSDGSKVVVYDISQGKAGASVVGSFSADSFLLSTALQNVYLLEPGKVQVRTFQGTVKQLLSYPKSDDEVVSMHASSHFLVIATASACLKLFDLSRREAKLWAGPKNFTGLIDSLGSISSAKCNSSGSRVSLQVTMSDGTTDSRLWVWDTESNCLQHFNFLTGLDDQQAALQGSQEEAGDRVEKGLPDRERFQAAREVEGRYVLRHCWDAVEEKLLVCETKRHPSRKPDQSSDSAVETLVVSLFCTKDHGILVEDCFPLAPPCSQLISVHIPFYYFVLDNVGTTSDVRSKQALQGEKPPQQQLSSLFSKALSSDSASCRRYHRNYVGMSRQEDVEAMMTFSYHLTLGNMDEAFRAIKLIKSKSVWQSLAAMCVKTKRLDVARVCLANMGHAGGARLLREAVAKHSEVEAQVACLAVVLGLYDDAERLLRACGRMDLLNHLQQNAGNWNQALEVAESADRMNLRNTYYKYAKHLEGTKKFPEAIKYFEKSGTQAFEVPHMLYDDLTSLEQYVSQSNDKSVWEWWAQYLEFKGRPAEAQEFYSKAGNLVAMARIYCALGQPDKASELCDSTEDRAACYWMACQHEKEGRLQQAIHYYNSAKAFGNAIRLCKDSNYDDRLLNMAIMGKADDMLEAARYYEGKEGYEEKCVLLYHKAGFTSKALELAFQTKQFAALHTISESFDCDTDPLLLQRCANFFVENSQFDRAVDLLASANKHEDAIRICKEQHVEMSEILAEKLSPPEGEHQTRMLEDLGDVCLEQRKYHLAAKKYTQAGQRLKAMKALLKSGDTEKICFFANVSRQKEVYIMAGHYLQSLDWQRNPQVMRNILTYYTKGKSPLHLAGFYIACAQLEIDEYNNYDKALGALSDAYKCLMRQQSSDGADSDPRLDKKIEYLKHKMTTINRFIKAKSGGDEDSIRQCKELLMQEDCEEHVVPAHIFAYMTEYFVRAGKWKMAHGCVEELQKRLDGYNVTSYIDAGVIRSIHKALDLEYDASKYEKKSMEAGDAGAEGVEDGVLEEELEG